MKFAADSGFQPLHLLSGLGLHMALEALTTRRRTGLSIPPPFERGLTDLARLGPFSWHVVFGFFIFRTSGVTSEVCKYSVQYSPYL
jgi:hypothetical protein